MSTLSHQVLQTPPSLFEIYLDAAKTTDPVAQEEALVQMQYASYDKIVDPMFGGLLDVYHALVRSRGDQGNRETNLMAWEESRINACTTTVIHQLIVSDWIPESEIQPSVQAVIAVANQVDPYGLFKGKISHVTKVRMQNTARYWHTNTQPGSVHRKRLEQIQCYLPETVGVKIGRLTDGILQHMPTPVYGT